MDIRSLILQHSTPSERVVSQLQNAMRAKLDIFNRPILLGDFVVWGCTNQSDKPFEVLKVVGYTDQKCWCVSDDSEDAERRLVRPQNMINITEQVRHNASNPITLDF